MSDDDGDGDWYGYEMVNDVTCGKSVSFFSCVSSLDHDTFYLAVGMCGQAGRRARRRAGEHTCGTHLLIFLFLGDVYLILFHLHSNFALLFRSSLTLATGWDLYVVQVCLLASSVRFGNPFHFPPPASLLWV